MVTSKDLLYNALDYDAFWNTSKLRKNAQPSKSRKLQIDKLLKAFDITKKNTKAPLQVPKHINEDITVESVYFTSSNPKSLSRTEYIKALTDFQYFTRGEFIADADRSKYHDLIGQIILTIKAIIPAQSKNSDQDPVNLVRLFSDLYSFRLGIYYMPGYRFDKKMTEKFSIEDEYSFHLRNRFFKLMVDDFSEIDEFLCLLIDPEKRDFEEEEIGYPDFDLEAIDDEWHQAHRK